MADELARFTASILKHEASYRGAFFFIKSSNIAGGRKDAKKVFVDSDLQVIEDLGLKQKVFTVNGSISDRRDNSGQIITPYSEVRNTLIAALDKGGIGILVHPWHGRLENIVCRTYTLDEDVSSLGDANVSITFEISNTDGIPISNPFVLTNIATKSTAVAAVASSIFGSLWKVTATATGNFQAAVNKGEKFIDAVTAATRPVVTLADEIDEHSNLLASFSNNFVSLVNNPTSLAESIDGIMASVSNLIVTPEGTLIAFKSLFDFGDNDIDPPHTTFSSEERRNNNNIFTAMVQGTALGYSYLAASEIEYKTVEEINEKEASLEEQYQKLFLSEDIDIELIEEITDMRTIVQGYFNEQKLITSKVITIQTNPMSTRLLAYSYYGDSSDGEAIAELNELYDLAYQQGDIRIFTA